MRVSPFLVSQHKKHEKHEALVVGVARRSFKKMIRGTGGVLIGEESAHKSCG